MVKSFKELMVWQKSYKLVLDIYRATSNFPSHELFCLRPQVRRCAVSVVSNIAKGYQRQYTGEYVHFLSVALGSCAELETQLICPGT